MSHNIERRTLTGFELRADEATGFSDRKISGYAAVFNSYSGNLGGFKERIMPGSFSSVLSGPKRSDVCCLLNHDPSMVLGRVGAGTLTLRQDDKGLWFQCEMPNTTAGRDTYESVKRGDLRGASFGFTMDPDGSGDSWDEADDDPEDRGRRFARRTIKNFGGLLDVSPVAYPAYAATGIAARINPQMVEIPATATPEIRSLIFKERLNWVENFAPAERRRQLLHHILSL